jgi:hypothetical protein
MKALVSIAILGIAITAYAESLTFPDFQIKVQDGWVHSIESGPQSHSELGERINIYHPDRNATLTIQPYSTPDFVGKEILRNMTNVDSSTLLTWQDWGDYSGYQFDYSERGSFFRQWWLANETTIMFIVYESDTESRDAEIDEIDKIVISLRVNTT